MAQYDGVRMAVGRPTVTGGSALNKQTMATQVWVNDSVAANDTLYFGKLPKGAIITGGRVFSGRYASGTSAGSCSFSFCLGVDQIVKDASATTYSVASLTSGLGFFGPIDYNPTTSNAPLATRHFQSGFSSPLGGLLVTVGPLTTTVEGTNVFGTVTVSAGSGSGISSYLNLELDYVTGTYT